MLGSLILMAPSLLDAGVKEGFQICGEKLRPARQVSCRDLSGCNAILDRPRRNVEDSGEVTNGVDRLEGESLERQDLLQERKLYSWILVHDGEVLSHPTAWR